MLLRSRRFDRDVLAVPDVTHLVSPSDLIAAYSQIAARAHQQAIEAIGATLPPFDGAEYFTPEKEKVRARVNEWIRSSKDYVDSREMLSMRVFSSSIRFSENFTDGCQEKDDPRAGRRGRRFARDPLCARAAQRP